MFTTSQTRPSTQRPRACARFLLQAAAAERSGDAVADPRPSHADTCETCREEIQRQRTALAALRRAAEAMAADAEESGAAALSAGRRRVVLEQATARPGVGWGLLPLLDWRPAGAMAAAAAVTVVIGLGAWSLEPANLGSRESSTTQLASVAIGADLQVVAEGSAVRLSWSSDGRTEHRVIRATDPRDLESGRVATVQGNQWVDPDANGARVVFYVVD